jgi:methylenetetrahydrofolate dehydrogenase (NADP+)/methenyltetrahydrofolate cyclohydrolase
MTELESKILDGKAAAAEIRAETAVAARAMAAAGARPPQLVAVLVGDNPASQAYVGSKVRGCGEVGMLSRTLRLPAETTEAELLALLDELNADDAVDGILVQLPLPAGIDDQAVIDAIDPAKDVDGFHPVNAGRLAIGEDGLVPCTPLGCLMLLRDRLGDLTGLDAVVIGRSNIVGKPVAQLLLRENCTVTIAHSRSRDLPAITRRADIVVAAVGRAGLVRGDWLKPGATVIDVGINRVETEDGTKLRGDVDFESAAAVAGAITPVPGGVGPMTIAVLLRNTLVAAFARIGLKAPEGL